MPVNQLFFFYVISAADQNFLINNKIKKIQLVRAVGSLLQVSVGLQPESGPSGE